MIIGIDASRYSHNEATGVEWYSWHIINQLIKEIEKKEYFEGILYSRYPLTLPSHGPKIKSRVICGRKFWTLLHLSREMMRKKKPDALFVPSHVLPLRLPNKSIITIHDVAFKYLKSSYSYFQYKYLNWSTKFAVKNADKIIVPSEATKRDLISFFKCPEEKIRVVYHGFDAPKIDKKSIDKVFETSDAFKHFGINKGMDYLLFVGRLESKKNLSRTVEAFKDFSRMHPNYKLILAGKRGVGFDQILKVVEKNKLNGKVIMPGYITEEEKAALYKYTKAFIFPSLYEGFGLPILEAFHYGKPVITSHVSCLPEVAGDAAHFVDPYDVQIIAAGLEKVINDTDYSQELISKGKERLKDFTWEKAARETFEVIID